VLTLHPTLLIGPSEWDAARMPKTEFERRIAAVWQRCPAAAGAIVYGAPAHHAELAYLTNFIPKLEPALALIARDGVPRLLVGGGANMMGAARPLTWIERVGPLRDVPNEIKRWLADGAGANGMTVLIGADYMPSALRRAVVAAAGEGTARDASADLWRLMRRKSKPERDVIREACVILAAAMAAIGEAQRAGAGVTAAVLAGEGAANERGAQDVRSLFSVDGGRTLRPFETSIERSIDPLQVYLAVRHLNYWAEGFGLFSGRLQPAATTAADALRRAIAAVRAGSEVDGVARMIATAIQPFHAHPVTENSIGNSIGLALEEPPHTDLGKTFAAGEVYSLRVGVTDAAQNHAIVSAMIDVGDNSRDVLWPAGDVR
jgi:Xaa-Pro aminopeptidase